MDRVAAAVFFIIVPIAFNVTFFALQKRFDYPDILRRPTDEILRRFAAGGAALRQLWYAFTFFTRQPAYQIARSISWIISSYTV